MLGPLLEVQMSKKCTALWREAHFEVKMYKTLGVRASFLQVQMSKKCTPLWREAHFQVKMYKTLRVQTIFEGSDVEKVYAVVARSSLRSHTNYITLHYTPVCSTTLNYTTPHYITLNDTATQIDG